MAIILPRRSLNFDFVRDGQASGDNYTDELSKLDSLLTFARASTATRFNATGALETVAAGQPRFDFDPVTLACKGLLIEEARTNLLTRSNEFSHSDWVKNTLTLNSSSIAAFGTTVYQYTGASSDSYLYRAFTGTAAAYSGSVWLRVPSGTATVQLVLFQGALVVVQQITCALTTTWQRFSVSATLAASTHALMIGGVGSWGVGKVIQIGFAQCELGGFASSYIPTTTAAVTRAKESCVANSIVPWLNKTGVATVLADYSPRFPSALGEIPVPFALDAAIYGQTNGSTYTQVNNNGTYTTDAPTLVSGDAIRLAASFAVGRVAMSVNGRTVVASAQTIAAPTTLYLGCYTALSYHLNGYLRRFVYLPYAVSDVMLKAMST